MLWAAPLLVQGAATDYHAGMSARGAVGRGVDRDPPSGPRLPALRYACNDD